MTVVVRNPVLNTIYHPKEIEENFADLVRKFGDIGRDDIAPDADIAISKLSTAKEEVIVSMTVHAESLAAGWPADDGTVLAASPIPGANGDTAWTLTEVGTVCTDSGGVGLQAAARLIYADYAGGVLTTSTITTFNVTGGCTGSNSTGGYLARSELTDSIALAANAKFLGIQSTRAEASTLTAQGSFFKVTCRLIRDIQA